MCKPSIASLATEISLLQNGRCLSCWVRNPAIAQLRLNSLSRRHYANKTDTQTPNTPDGNVTIKPAGSRAPANKNLSSPLQFQQNPAGEQSAQPGDANFTPPTLDRPIGSPYPPEAGQNTGIDTRSMRKRRDDFVDYDRHISRRQELTKQVAKPYFREWSNLRYHQGKTFVSNSRLFKGDRALYFPNMHGVTLASPKDRQDTTTQLRGKISVVNLFSSVWAETQVATFTGPQQNPGLAEILASSGQLAQRVDINLEENRMKAWLIKRFMWQMRGKLPLEQHALYFLVQKGFDEGLKEAIGMMNSRVGYVYLLDADCRIRWAGSGPSEPTELESLNAGLRKLVAERKASAESQ